MPIGVIVNSIVIFAGGLLGGAVGSKLSEGIKEKLIMIFGLMLHGHGYNHCYPYEETCLP